jgi:hypothetical protein
LLLEVQVSGILENEEDVVARWWVKKKKEAWRWNRG